MRTDKGQDCICRVYIGDPKRIPAHLRPYFHESIARKLLRRLIGLAALLFFFSADPVWRSRECRFPVNQIGDDTLLFSWKIEDVSLLLKECDFHLFAQDCGIAYSSSMILLVRLLLSLTEKCNPVCCFCPEERGGAAQE